jgi:zinc/manganese transport system permease protein
MMNASMTVVLPALLAGLLVAATHVPLGVQVLARGIIFIDIAIAQIAGLGVLLADYFGYEPQGIVVQVSALAAALLGALLLTWTERRWPEVQEAIIGVVFVLAATAQILLLAGNPHAGEQLKDLLVGQILWVSSEQLVVVAVLTAVVLGIWFGSAGRGGQLLFYLLFGISVTASVQLVGVYLVFATLIIPALATRHALRYRLLKAYVLAALGYAVGLSLSAWLDLPSGAAVVWTLGAFGIGVFALEHLQVSALTGGKAGHSAPGKG